MHRHPVLTAGLTSCLSPARTTAGGFAPLPPGPVPGAAQNQDMWLLILEAALALALLLFMVWWVMFSGRNKGELQDADDRPARDTPPPQRDRH